MTIRNPLRARDTILMAAALRSLGVGGEDIDPLPGSPAGSHDWRVVPRRCTDRPRSTSAWPGRSCGPAPAAALAQGDVAFDGDPRARERPLGPVVDALRLLGADLGDGGRGGLPLVVHGHGGLRGGEVTVDASGSSQFVSALLLAGARFEQGLVLRHHSVHGGVPSAPHVAMTVAMLRERGSTSTTARPTSGASRRVRSAPSTPWSSPTSPTPRRSSPPRWSPAGPSPSPTGRRAPRRPATPCAACSTDLGASVELTPAGLTVTGSGTIVGIDADLHEVGELTPVLAAVAALAETPSTLHGIAHLRHHETDRLAALSAELAPSGPRSPRPPTASRSCPRAARGRFATHDDHRLATAAAVLGLVVPGVLVEDVATTGKTLPGFTDLGTRCSGAPRRDGVTA